MRILLLSCAWVGSLTAATATLPTPVERLIAADADNRNAARVRYVKEITATCDEVLAVLRRELSAAMQREDLALALAIREKVAEVEAQRTAVMAAGRQAASDPQVMERLMEQTWEAVIGGKTHAFTFRSDGTCAIVGGRVTGTWFDLPDSNTIRIRWSGTTVDDLVGYRVDNTGWTYQKHGLAPVPLRPQESKPAAVEEEEKSPVERWRERAARRGRGR